MSNNPNAVFAFINSKTDIVQRAYYDAVALTFKEDHIGIAPPTYYKEVNNIFLNYTAYDNFLSFFVESDMHCYTNTPFFFTADASSIVANGFTGEKRLIDFITELEAFEGHTFVKNVCKGDLIDLGDEHERDSKYCEKGLERTVML